MHIINLLYSISGFSVGMLVGMTGVGGGALMTPLLILLFGIHPAIAVGSDLLYAAITKTGGSLIHGISGTIEWRVVGRLACGSVPMTAVTLFLLSKLDLTDSTASGLITVVLSGTLFFTAAVLILRQKIVAHFATRAAQLEPCAAVLTILADAVLGVLVSISSVGAGAIGVSALLLLHPRLPTASIVGTDIAHAVPLTLIAGIGHGILGSTDWALIGSLLIGSLPGIVIGSYLSTRVPDMVLRLAVAVALFVVGGKLML